MLKREFICRDISASQNEVLKFIICDDGVAHRVILDHFYFRMFYPEVDRADLVFEKLKMYARIQYVKDITCDKDEVIDIIESSNNSRFQWKVEYKESELNTNI